MSTTIDSKVVEMRFDNKQFESNVRTSMSTLDKLKQSLNLTGASKGLESINAAAKKTDFSGMAKGIDTVNAKFSAMQVMGVTALANITNSAVNAGKRMVSALTIDPIKTGFQEYETQINAVQTILANTQKEGTNVEIVNKALDELNTYADKTIYNFTEMTRNIGTFTAAGVKLQTSVDAIQGIANLAAVSGSTSQQASTAMYQLSQALASGTVKLMDWNSVVNAGMGGQVFQDALRETSELLGTGAEAAIKAEGSFRDSLHTGWLTAEVLTETLKKFTTSGAIEKVAEYTGLSKEAVQAALDNAEAQYGEADAIAKVSEELAKQTGTSAETIKSTLQFAKTAEDAATKVKTFSQLWDTMKEAAQSGWAQTWRLIIGDFEEAGELLTGISDFFNGIITKMNDARNKLLESALGKSFSSLSEKMNKLLEPAKKAVDTVKEVNTAIADLGAIVDDVILGKFGNGQARFDKLTESGYNWMKVQNQVNEKLGDSHRYTEEQIAAQDKLLGSQTETAKATSETSEETTKLTDAQKDQIKQLAKLSDEQLRSKGYTEEQIAAFQELRDTADQLGIPLDTFIDKMDEINGRWLLWNSFGNIGKMLTQIFGAIGKAWRDVFDPIKPEQIFNIIAAFHKFTASLILNKESAEDLRKTFKGLFAILDIVATIAGGGIKIAFEVLSAILGAFDMDILSLTGSIGEAIYKFRDWLFEGNALAKNFDKLLDKLPKAVDEIKEWFDAFKETPVVEKFVTAIEAIADAFDKLFSGKIDIGEFAQELGTNFAKALTSLPEMAKEIGKDFIAGFQNGLGDGVKGVIDKIVDFCLNFVSSFAEALGVQSPSWKAYEIAVDFFQGAINGIKAMLSPVIGAVKFIGEQIINAFKSLWDFLTDENGSIEWGKIFAAGMAGSMLYVLKKLADAIDGITGVLGGFSELCESAADAIKRLGKSISMDFKAKAIQKMAISLALLVGSIWLLTQIDDIGKLWNAVAIIGVLAGILVGLAVAMDKMSQASVKIGKSGASIDGLKSGLMQISIALLLLAVIVKIIGGMDVEQAKQGFIGLAGVAVGMLAFLALCGAISLYAKDMDKVSGTLIKMSIAMLLMVTVIKQIGGMDPADIVVGVAVMEVFMLLFAQMAIVNRLAGNNASKFGGTLMKMAVAMLLMAVVAKIVSGMDPADILSGVAVMEVFVLLFAQMAIVNRLAGNNVAKFGGTVVKMSLSMLLMAGVIKIIASMNPADVLKGVIVMQAFVLLIAEMLLVAKLGKDTGKLAGTILAMSAAIAILAGVAVLLSLIDLGGLAKGLVAVGLLSLMMAGMVKALKGAQNVKGAIMMMAIAIGVMAASVVALSFIEPGKLAGATAAIAILMGMFVLIEKSSKNITKSVASTAVMVGVVAALAGILYLLSRLEVESTLEIAASLSLLMGTLAVSMQLISKAGSSAMSAMPAAFAMSGVLAIIATILGILGSLNLTSTNEIATSLSMLMLSLSASILVISKTGASAMAAMPAAYAMSGVLAIIAVILGVLAKLNVGPTLEIAASLSILLLSLSAACLIMAGAAAIATVAAAGLVPMMTLMVGMGALMAVIAGLVTWVPDLESFLSKALPILKLIGEGIGEFLGGIISGIANSVMDILPRFGMSLSGFMMGLQPFIALAGNIDSSVLEGIGYLSGAILALTAANLISGIGQFLSFGQSFADLGTQLSNFITNAQPFLTGIQGIDPSSIESANTLANLILTLSKAELLSGINNLISWFTGGNSFEDFGTQLTSFGNAMKSFSESISGITLDEAAINTVVTAGTKLAELQSSLEPMGGVVQWFTGERDFATFGVQIVAFGNAMKSFAESISGITLDETALSTVISAGTKLAELQSSLEPMGGVIQWFTGERDFATFGTQIVAFGGAMKSFSESITGITLDEDALSTVISAGAKLAELQSSLEPMNGVIQWFTGERNFATFGTQIVAFGSAISNFAGSIGEGINETAVTSVINAGTMITELQKALPEETWFDGKMNLTEFSGYVSDFSTAMSDFSSKASEINPEGMNTAITSAKKIKSLIDSLVDIDVSGVKTFTGIGAGGIGADGAVSDIAEAIADFSKKTAGIDVAAVSTSVSAALKLKSLIASLIGLDASGIENFKIGSIGTAMKNYASKVADIDTGVVSSSISSANRLKNFIAGLAGLDASGVSNFKPASIGISLKSYAASVGGFDSGSVSSSITAATRLKNFIASLAGLDSSGVGSFVTAINQLGTVSIDGIVKSFSGASSKMLTAGSNLIESVVKGMKSKQSSVTATVTNLLNSTQKSITSKADMFQSAGALLMTKFVSGIKSRTSAISSTIRSALSSAASSIRLYYSSFYSAGGYLGDGLVSGINSKKQAAYNAGYALGKKAVQGEKDGQKSNSPSKLTIQAGKWLGEGLVIGIEKMGSKVYNAGYDLGDSAASSMSKSIAAVSDLIDSDMDMQPTIRPVLDLSDVEHGASTIGGMFRNNLNIGARANLNAISSMMNENNQNGGMSDVVSAINKLRKDLGNVGNTSYNINGITYDDGSNVSEAVQALVRATRMEGRV